MTRAELLTRLYDLEAEITSVKEAIAALDTLMPEAMPTRRWSHNGSPIATCVAAVLLETKRPVRGREIVELLEVRGLKSKNLKGAVASALVRLMRRGVVARVAHGTYQWIDADSGEAVVERLGNIIPFVPREQRDRLAA